MNRFDQSTLDCHEKGITYDVTKDPMLKDYMAPHLPLYEDDDDGDIKMHIHESTYDQYANAEVLLPHEGKHDPYPILDTRVYDVEFPNVSEVSYAENVIAENMFVMCDPEGNQYLLTNEIVDHKKDDHAIDVANQYITVNGRKSKSTTTAGLSLCVKWKDGTTSWEKLTDVKESNPAQFA
eukprot:3587953-Ditylum_brightwellii.AAC.1